MPDVVIIGGGVVGSYLASRLAGAGHNITVIDKKPEIGGPVCCTGIISRECVSTYGIAKDIVLRNFNAARVFPPDNKTIELRRPEIQACVVDRGALDLTMAQRAQVAGAVFYSDTRVKDIDIREDCVIISASGRISQVKAEIVIDASGFHSGISELLGAGKPADFVIGAQAAVATNGIHELEIYLNRRIAPGFFGWLVPVSEKKALVGLLSRRNAREYLKSLLALLTEGKKILPESDAISVRGIPLKPLARTYGKRFIIVGSAAGQVKPLTGGGIYYGLLSADLAFTTVNQALEEHNFAAAKLALYQKAWQQKLGKELRRSYRARKIFERLSDRQLSKTLDIAVRAGMIEAMLADPAVSFDWHGDLAAKLVKEKALAGILELVKSPFQAIKQAN